MQYFNSAHPAIGTVLKKECIYCNHDDHLKLQTLINDLFNWFINITSISNHSHDKEITIKHKSIGCTHTQIQYRLLLHICLSPPKNKITQLNKTKKSQLNKTNSHTHPAQSCSYEPTKPSSRDTIAAKLQPSQYHPQCLISTFNCTL